ncbi:5'-nucleotidase [Aliarcobacter butzleri]|uniref:5'-nucleotidase n=1 Tax=Aliarcobacter butzleri TaxID=28197 RepID=UPI003AFAE04A
MSLNLKETLVIGISATALFDLSESDKLFQKEFKDNPETAIDNYRKYMLENEENILKEGIGYPLVKALLSLNKYQKDKEPPLVEVVIMSRKPRYRS